jgi:hypothetical protein
MALIGPGRPGLPNLTPERTFSERHRCTLSEASRCVAACVAFQTKEAADPLAGVDVPSQ